MKLISLQIQNIRGICKDFNLHLDGNNYILLGPNGSGKSSVVDALEFLFTGDISRLKGKGTKGITLYEHGKNINANRNEVIVKGIIKLDGDESEISLKRSMENPNLLEYNEKYEDVLEPVLKLAERSQYVLDRSELLDFIQTTDGERDKQIQSLLNLKDIEKVRKILVKLSNKLEKEAKNSKNNWEKAKNKILTKISKKKYEEKQVLDYISEKREILGGKKISSLDPELIKKDIREPHLKDDSISTLGIDSIKRITENLSKDDLEKFKRKILDFDKSIREKVYRIKTDKSLFKELSRLKLIRLGIENIDKSGNCPLCDKEWEKGALKKYLNKKLGKAQEAKHIKQKIEQEISKLNNLLNQLISNLEEVNRYNKQLKLKRIYPNISKWLEKFNDFTSKLNSPIETCEYLEYPRTELTKLLEFEKDPDIFKNNFSDIKEKIPKKSPKLQAWDNLTELKFKLENLIEAESDYKSASLYSKRADLILKNFVNNKKLVLDSLWCEIESRFEELYKQLHRDEREFIAQLEQKEKGLSLKVDFYGKGTYPPNALHSEGHQDSMGLCLYLVLAEKVNANLINLIVLDDVIMSIDSGHRRGICRILRDSFPNKQFFICTHDRTWAEQLRHEGIVSSKNVLEFSGWDINMGPKYDENGDIWDQIEEDLEHNNIPSAAHKLRRGMEKFLHDVCDRIKAKVVHKTNYQWTFGELIQPAMKRYSKLLNKAKKAANSWAKLETMEELRKIEDHKKLIYKEAHLEQWAINPNVHFNRWASFSKEDFNPVVKTFKDFTELFKCQNCEGTIKVIPSGHKDEMVICPCKDINWNLVVKQN